VGNVEGKRIAHLQCHFGIDTLCLARRGASCVGLDFSSVAIAAAVDLQRQTNLYASFVAGNIYDARALLEGSFEMVYVTCGAPSAGCPTSPAGPMLWHHS
jgi:2-polyprenyl-3-methyl-5-hydroxy-6-metoxy-1,4-benzoquinol methylase